jgi:opacity protein-like surface antigen
MLHLRPLLLSLLFSMVAFGQYGEFGVQVGATSIGNRGLADSLSPRGISNQVQSTWSLRDGWRLGLKFTANSGFITGHEFGYGYVRTALRPLDTSTDLGMAVHQGTYDFLLYGTPRGSRIRPFALGGVHFGNFVPPGSSAAQGGGENKFGFQYGGGVKVKLTESFLMRFDLKQFNTGKPFAIIFGLPNSGRLRITEISMGFSFTL